MTLEEMRECSTPSNKPWTMTRMANMFARGSPSYAMLAEEEEEEEEKVLLLLPPQKVEMAVWSP